MTQFQRSFAYLVLRLLCSILFSFCVLTNTVSAQTVVLHLKSGDQISGLVLSENTNQVVISNVWVKALSVPLSQISKREIIKAPTPAPSIADKQTATTPHRIPPNPVKSGSTTNTVVCEASHAVPASTNFIVGRYTVTPEEWRQALIALRRRMAELDANPESTPTLPQLARAPFLPWPKSKGTWHGQINVGSSVILNATEQEDYSGHVKLVYTKPYQSHPNKFFRNALDLDGEYQRTDGQVSANNARANNKSDFDLWDRYYAYAQAGAGYDRIQNIEFQYQFGPGGGIHLVRHSNFALNTEAGLTYRNQYNKGTPNLETLYVRLAEDFTWEILRNLKFTQNVAFYPDLQNAGQYHNDFTSTLSYGFWKNLTLDLTVADHYNTQLSSGTNPNEFDFRSSLGYTF